MLTGEEFEDLFRRTAPEVHAYLQRRVGSDADDLLGEVYVIAWRRRRELPEPALHRAWLYGVARRLVLADGRRRSRAAEAAAALARQGAPAPDEDRTATVRRAIDALGEADREIVRLTSWEGLTVAEAAVSLGIRPGAARVRLHRARRRLAADPEVAALAVATRPADRDRAR